MASGAPIDEFRNESVEAGLGRRLRAGDWDALDAVHAEHQARLKRLAAAFGFSESDAEDVVQEAFLRVWRFREQAPLESGKLGSWLTAILANCGREHISRNTRWRVLRKLLGLARREPAADAEAEVEARELWEQVSVALKDLEPVDRMVLVLARLEGLKAPEIAKMLGMQPGAIRVRLFRAMQLLRKKLEENEEW